MVRSKPSSKKQKRGGVDFKKIKHKIGRKLPPPKNATNTQIKSKAIVLPEQSMASERAGMAVNKRGLTLRELLQQTTHHNAHVRRAALQGIKDLVLKHPSELKLHKSAIIEKLCVRMCDSDKVVRDSFYNLLQSLIFPSLKEDIAISTLSTVSTLMMPHIFNAMTHISMEIRLMAFKFLELVVLNFPSSFLTHAEMVLDNYIGVLKDNEICLQDKSKLNSVLGGLAHCLALVTSKRGNGDTSSQLIQNYTEEGHLNPLSSAIDENNSKSRFCIVLKLEGLTQILVNCVEDSVSLLCAKLDADALSNEALLSALHCLNLICRIFMHEIKKPQMKFGICKPPSYGPDWVRSTILVHLQKLWKVKHLFDEKGDDKFFIFNTKVAEILLRLSECMDSKTVPAENLCEFIVSLLGKAKTQRNKELLEKHLGPLLTFVPGLVSNARGDFKGLLLEAFTDAYKNCKVDCKLILVYLVAVEEMLLPDNSKSWFAENDPELLEYHSAWINELPRILLQSVGKDPSVTKVVLELLLQIGKYFPTKEYGNLQPLIQFYGVKTSSGTMELGPFVKLPRDCQELAICCVYYFCSLLPDILEALAFCCLRDELEPFMLFRMVEVLQSAYKAGHLQISEQVGLLLSLVARFKVCPEVYHAQDSDGKVSNWSTFKSLNHIVLTFLCQMGDGSLVLELLWNNLFNEMARKPSLHNMNGLFKIIVALDARTTRLSDEDIINLSSWIAGYLVDTASDLSRDIELNLQSDKMRLFQYFIKPCIFLFCGNNKVLHHTLELINSFAMGEKLLFSSLFDLNRPVELSCRAYAVLTILIFLYNDRRLHRDLSSCKSAIIIILQNIQNVLDSNRPEMTYDEKQKLQCAFDQLKTKASQLDCWDRSELEGLLSTT